LAHFIVSNVPLPATASFTYPLDATQQDWWSPEDGREYEQRVDVMVKQADAYEVHGQHVKGKLTCGENIADLGGLLLGDIAIMKGE
jgi:putative endopeptidase